MRDEIEHLRADIKAKARLLNGQRDEIKHLRQTIHDSIELLSDAEVRTEEAVDNALIRLESALK